MRRHSIAGGAVQDLWGAGAAAHVLRGVSCARPTCSPTAARATAEHCWIYAVDRACAASGMLGPGVERLGAGEAAVPLSGGTASSGVRLQA